MNSFRALFRYLVAGVAALSTSAAVMAADPYPTQPIRMVVPLGPGSAIDTLARTVSEALRNELKTTIVIDNRVGAGGTLGAAAVAKAKPDGHTLGILHSSVLVTAPAIMPGLPYDPRKDFTYIGNLVSIPVVLVVPANSKIKTLEDYIAVAKQEPGKLTCGFIGAGSHSHFNLELLQTASNTSLNHIPYSGGPAGLMNALYAGDIASASATWASFAEQVRSGKLRVLASTEPLKEMPSVPTFASKGYPQAGLAVLISVIGPAGLPKDVTDTLTVAVKRVMDDPKLVETVEKQGNQALYEAPAGLASRIDRELTLLTGLGRRMGIKPE
jgi:tripartite-type tricarboxylate transporter receptor subunit TctC